jgi:hypothetical protein
MVPCGADPPTFGLGAQVLFYEGPKTTCRLFP